MRFCVTQTPHRDGILVYGGKLPRMFDLGGSSGDKILTI
jgi:hypothetical protein